jgi:acyl-CoA reductase-like NAD-dependent aldehyde dehydrogenase
VTAAGRRAVVAKTYKMYLGGAFVRSESGRSDATTDHDGEHLANVPRGSRKDVRDAVKAARAGAAKWAGATAYNRGQVLYRFAEALESRADELARSAAERQGGSLGDARAEVGAAVDTLVHYAGWTDKLPAIMGGINPVAMPYLSFSAPEATGVVAVLAPDEPDLLGLIREVAPALAAGNAVVALVSRRWPLRPLDLGEIANVSDVPAGALNLLSGRIDELVDPLCGHRDVNAIVDATGDAERAEAIDLLAAETVKRVLRVGGGRFGGDGIGAGSLARLEALTELKTAWHPVGT